MAKEIMQGDEYPISFKIKMHGKPIDINTIEMVEFVIGEMVKKYPDIVYYDADSSKFKVFLSQEETFAISKSIPVQVRVKFNSGDVVGEDLGTINIIKSLSKEVL